jgi:EAL domain-containing protein (putative c-di-GMP-specific phosphodiesterase class I)
VLNLGRSLGIKVVAEGIETEAQAEHLRALECDFGQGFLYSKAVAASRVPGLVARYRPAGADAAPPARRPLRLVAGKR